MRRLPEIKRHSTANQKSGISIQAVERSIRSITYLDNSEGAH